MHDHYFAKGWIEASIALDRAMSEAERAILHWPDAGLPAPRPYPQLAAGERWVIARHYWVAYQPTQPPVIVGVFRDTGDIPRRYRDLAG